LAPRPPDRSRTPSGYRASPTTITSTVVFSPLLLAGIDLGGTNIRVGLASKEAPDRVTARRFARTPHADGVHAIVDIMKKLLDECLDEASSGIRQVAALGCVVPGIVDTERGMVVDAANLEGWRGVRLREILEERLGVACVVENDVNAAALAEYHCGAGKQSSSLAFMTVSTGVAAGLIVAGEVLRGAHNAAGELAYMIPERSLLNTTWGSSGCLEETAAGMGLAQAWSLQRGIAYDPGLAQQVFAAARDGDGEAVAIVDRAADYLGLAATALCSVFDPEVLILGGSVAQNEPVIRERIESLLRRALASPPIVRPATLEGEAPLVGALVLAARLRPRTDTYARYA